MFEIGIGATFQFVDDIQGSMPPMLEYLKRDISNRRSRMPTRTNATMKKPLKISNSSDKKDEQKIGVTQQLIVEMPKVQKVTNIVSEVMQQQKA